MTLLSYNWQYLWRGPHVRGPQITDNIYGDYRFHDSDDFPYAAVSAVAYGHYYYKSLQYFGVKITYSDSFKEGDPLKDVKTFNCL